VSEQQIPGGIIATTERTIGQLTTRFTGMLTALAQTMGTLFTKLSKGGHAEFNHWVCVIPTLFIILFERDYDLT
jgi:hypothetical protein